MLMPSHPVRLSSATSRPGSEADALRRVLLGLPLPTLLLSPMMAGCGGASGGIGAVNSMPNRATGKAMSKAEECDDGDMKSCNWIGIWFMVGGAGKDRKDEGRRFLRHACKEGYQPSCKRANVLARRGSSSTTSGTTSSPASSSSSGARQVSESALPYSAPENVRTVARRCDGGNLKSCHGVGAWLLLGKGDTPGKKRRIEGLKIIQTNCKNGYEKSCELIAKLKEMIRKKKQESGSI